MKKFLSSTKTLTVLLLITFISLGTYAYMLLRPISYGIDYHNETVYEGVTFEGTMEFNKDNTLIIKNTNFEEELTSFYYYKNGYVFLTLATTAEEYETEVAYINENFEEALNTPFYSEKINAFKLVNEGPDGYTTEYVCVFANMFAWIGGAVELVLVGITVLSMILCKKSKQEDIQ